MPVSSLGTDRDDARTNAGSTPYARPPKRTGTGMLTLGWAVDQSRRAFRAKSRGSRVHPDGRRTASSSRGGDGTPGTPTRGAPREMDDAGARSPKSPRRVPPGAGPGTCLGAVIALMGFGRGGTKAIAAAERAREAARSGKLRGVPRLASTPEHRATPSRASRGGSSSRLGSESRRHRRTPRTAERDDGAFPSAGGLPPPSRSASMRFAPAPGEAAEPRGLWNDPSPASRGTEVPSAATGEGLSTHAREGRFGDDGWNGLRATHETRRELFSSTPSDRNQSQTGW